MMMMAACAAVWLQRKEDPITVFMGEGRGVLPPSGRLPVLK